jgi:multidrug resistance efflux pump
MKEAKRVEPLNFFDQYYKFAEQNWNSFMKGVPFNDMYLQWWSLAMESFSRYQQTLQEFNERLLQASGYPTRDDLSRVNRQLHEISNHLEEVENGLSDHLDEKQSENSQLKDKIAALQAEIDRLRAELADRR